MSKKEQAQPIATKDGEKISDNASSEPVWRDFKSGEEIPLSELSEEDLVDKVEDVETRISQHRRSIISHQKAIVTLTKVKNDLANECSKRDIPNLLIPELEFVN